jgi:hypothetical protein
MDEDMLLQDPSSDVESEAHFPQNRMEKTKVIKKLE